MTCHISRHKIKLERRTNQTRACGRPTPRQTRTETTRGSECAQTGESRKRHVSHADTPPPPRRPSRTHSRLLSQTLPQTHGPFIDCQLSVILDNMFSELCTSFRTEPEVLLSTTDRSFSAPWTPSDTIALHASYAWSAFSTNTNLTARSLTAQSASVVRKKCRN